MADKKFAIVVTAIDRFSGVFQKAVASVLALNKPMAQTQQQLREIDKDRKIRSFTDDLKTMQGVMTDSLGAVTALVPGLGVLGGIGTMAALATGARNWTTWAQGAYNAHNILGLTIKDLQTFETALQAAGGQSGQATDALGQFNSVLSDIRFNVPGSQGLRNLLQGAGIDPGTRENARDTIEVLKEVFAHYDRLRAAGRLPSAQKFLENFALGTMAPLASRGARERDARIAQAARNVPLTMAQAKAADEAANTFSIMGTQALGFAGNALEAIGGTIDLMANLATDSKTRGKFAGFVAEDVKAFRDRKVDAFRRGLRGEVPGAVAPGAGVPPAAAPRVGPLGQFAPRPGESVDAWSDRKAAASRADAIDELKRLHPQIFAPVPSVALPERRLVVTVNLNGAPPGSTADTRSDAGVEGTTHFYNFMPSQGP